MTLKQKTTKTMRVLNAIVFLSLVGSQASALALFFPVKTRAPIASHHATISTSSIPQDDLEEHPQNQQNTPDKTDPPSNDEASLILKGDISTRSKSLPIICEDRLFQFFRKPTYRNLLVSGGGERPVETLTVTKTMLQEWTEKCKQLGAALPDEEDSILSVESRGIEFPGLKVKSVATVGVKYIDEQPPRHEFVLLGTQEEAKGLTPVVWIYNKLTGANQKKQGNDNTKAQSLSTVSYETNNGNVVFHTKSFLQIGITFPKVLLKVLPGDKAVIEEKASSSVQKTLEKDSVQSMKAYEAAYFNEMKL
ncbi:hypothetical protein IV203_037582 [Nitzschia inconspicua]|uniref:Uncharacterized protein n=1 Tax=Nitzschia inconspicua TaxID=303405 RepID=A0A9K3LM57_9STRA|nr:hypothetical protein IV203_037582 [Nitzschia inconspicua]